MEVKLQKKRKESMNAKKKRKDKNLSFSKRKKILTGKLQIIIRMIKRKFNQVELQILQFKMTFQ